MSTICHCNKEKKRNTHPHVKEASWNIAPLLSYLKSAESSPTQFGVFSPRVRVARTSRQPSVDCTPFYRQHLCRGQCIQERSRPQQHTWNSKPFVIFPAELLLHKVYISNILCGLRLWIQDIYSKEKPSLEMFISTLNEHILDKTMVKIRGLTICLIRVSVQWLTCWHCSLF
jgi:hypothetical protein